MKRCLLWSLLGLLVFIQGCSTPRSVANLRGQGTKQVFNGPYDAVWRAAVDAAQMGDLEIRDADRTTGYISAKRGIRFETFGENVAVWVRSLSPSQTEVEVISRQAGPPKFWIKNWEDEILRTVAANLTRETGTAIGSAPGYESSTVVTPPGTISVPPPPPPDLPTEVQLEQERRRIEALEAQVRAEERERERERLQAEIDRLRRELDEKEDRLRDLKNP
jgi:hypothetical protein